MGVDLDAEKIPLINIVRKNDALRSLYKLLIYVYLGVERTGDIKLLMGGNYYALLREAELRGLVKRGQGRVWLTPEGERVAGVLWECLLKLEKREETERDRESEGRQRR